VEPAAGALSRRHRRARLRACTARKHARGEEDFLVGPRTISSTKRWTWAKVCSSQVGFREFVLGWPSEHQMPAFEHFVEGRDRGFLVLEELATGEVHVGLWHPKACRPWATRSYRIPVLEGMSIRARKG
jgi:hypothetical protein